MSDYSEIPECVSALKDADIYAFDTETTGLCVRSDSIIGASFTVKKKKEYRSWYFKPSPEMPVEQLFKQFEPVFLDGQKLAILHNAKFDLQMLKRHNIKFFNKICCTKVMAWIINENRIGHLSLKGSDSLTKELFNIVLPSYEESSLSGSLFGKEEEAYACDDTLYSYKVYEELLPELEKQGLSKLFWELEMQILPIVADMEIRGMYMDVPTLHNLEKTLLEKYDSIAQEFYTKAGRKINIGSPEQLSAFFFDELKWEPKPGMERSKKGLYPTGEAILSKYAENDHKELAQLVLDYRGVLKLLQTYVRPLTKLALDDSHSRIHSTINQTGTVTGRFCVSADTEVVCSHGVFPITQVKAGDYVLTHQGRFKKVLNVIYKGMERMWSVRTSRNHKIRCTMNHRFLTPEGWKSLREIHFNDQLRVLEGSELVYDTLSWFMPSEVEDVWDLEVEEDHSYVGNGFVNHNSSSSPNLQNCPREKGTIKAAFKSPPGKTLIVADMSQLELRIMTHLSQDPTMLDIYRNGGDIHQTTQDAIGCKERATAKNCLDSSTLVTTDKGIRSIGHILGNSPDESIVPIDISLADGKGGYVHTSKGIAHDKMPCSIVVTKRSIVCCSNTHRFALKDGTLVEASDLKKDDILADTVVPPAISAEPVTIRINPFTNEVGNGPCTLVLNKDWAYLAGVIHGDGCCMNKHSITIAHGSSDEYEGWRLTLKNLLDSVGIPNFVGKDKRATRMGSRVVHHFLTQLGMCGKRHGLGIRVPWWVLEGGKDTISAYISGVIDTDGTIGKSGVSFTSKDPVWIGQLVYLCRSLGGNLTVCTSFNKTYKRFYYKGYVVSAGLKEFASNLSLRTYHATNLEEKLKSGAEVMYKSDNLVLQVLPYDDSRTFDFEVETDDHLYLQGGLLGHNTNFGLIYGMGPQTFQANLWRTARVALSIAECQKFDRAFFQKYPAIKDYHDTVDQFLRKHKYVRTLTGRRRHLADEMKANYGSALRQAINFTVQGLGADIVKIAMRNFQKELMKKRLENVLWEEVFMVMQVHDEIVIESPLDIAQEASDLLKHCMETAVTLSIPLIAEPKIAGPNGSWEDCK